jgi:RES domain-containing protein
MLVYRIAQLMYLNDMSGEGSRLFGGRWNSKGIPALYTSGTSSLAMLETLVYTPFTMLQGYGIATFELQNHWPVKELLPKDLPNDWDVFPSRRHTAIIGDKMLTAEDAIAMKVPSALLEEEWNLIINPQHPLAQEIRLVEKRPLVFNERFKNVLA